MTKTALSFCIERIASMEAIAEVAALVDQRLGVIALTSARG
jgi:hypothetical protein